MYLRRHFVVVARFGFPQLLCANGGTFIRKCAKKYRKSMAWSRLDDRKRRTEHLAKKKKNNNWFEAFCMMDEEPRRPSQSKNKTQDRVRVQNRANAPYGQDDEIPPFDDTPTEPISEEIFDDVKKPSPKRTTSKGNKTDSSKSSTSSSKSGSKKSTSGMSNRQTTSSKGTSRGKAQDKPLPADIAYRLQPYLLLFFGGLLLIMLFLSVVISGGNFDWTSQTHPFRWVGYHVENLLFGLLGYGAFLLPLLMIYMAICRLRDGEDCIRGGRGLMGMGIVVLSPL
jgi:hypothetical protein